MRRTRIAHLIFPRANPRRPLPEFALEAARVLSLRRELEVELILPVPAPGLVGLKKVVRALKGAPAWPREMNELLQKIEPKPTLIPYQPLPYASIESAAASISAALIARPRASRPALIQGSFLDEGGFAATVVARALGVPSIAVAHGSDVKHAGDRGAFSSGNRRRAKVALAGATEIIAVCHQLAQEIAVFGRTAKVIPFTSSADRFSLAAEGRTDPPSLLFVGRLSRAKGVDLLLLAFSKMARQDLGLRLVGSRCLSIDTRAEIARLGIATRVELLDEVEQAALPALLAKCTCVVLPSRAEGLPCVLVESLLVGRPVIASDVGGVAELIDEQVGKTVPSDDVNALKAAIEEVLARAENGGYPPARLREHALPYSWQGTGPALEALTFALTGTEANVLNAV